MITKLKLQGDMNSLTIHRSLPTRAVLFLQFPCQFGLLNDRAFKGLSQGHPSGIVTACQPRSQNLPKLVTRVTILDLKAVQSAHNYSELDAKVIPFGTTWINVIEDCHQVSYAQWTT